MSPQRSPGRRRAHHPLDIRSWVVRKSPEEIYQELTTRVGVVNDLLDPYRQDVAAWLQALEEALDQYVKSCGALPTAPLSPPLLRKHSRALIYELLVRYWCEHPFEGKELPRIVTRGFPWEVFPDEIHFLDLDPALLQTGFRRARLDRVLREFGRAAKVQTGSVPVTEALVTAAITEIYYGRASAWWHPLVQWVIAELLKTVHHSPDLEERKEATDSLDDVFDAFLPDLSQHISRREDALIAELKAYEELYGKVEPLYADLVAQGVTRAFRACARDRLDPRLDLSDLRQWRGKTVRDIALAMLAESRRVTPKTLSTRLTLARKARSVEEAWAGFRQRYETTPEMEHLALSPRDASVSEPPGSATAAS